MKTIFCLFRDYQNARQAVEHLVAERYNSGRLNSLILAQVARNLIDINPAQLYRKSSIPVTGDGPRTLDMLLSRNRPVALTGVGKVCASGELAGMLAKTAAALPNTASENGLAGALVDFGLPAETARKYVEGIRGGGLLLFLRTEDEQAPEVAGLLRSMEGPKHIAQVG